MAHYRNGIILGVVALVIAVGTPSFSAKPTPTPAQLIIQSVIVQANTLQINGENFGVNPVVTFAGATQTVTSSSSNQIVASLSSTPAAGTYRLTVVTGTASTQRGEFYVTIGAVGPQGLPGSSGIVTVKLLSGPVGNFPAVVALEYVFVGTPVTVTTEASETIVGTAQAAIGTSAETNFATFCYGLCYRAAGSSDPLQNFMGTNETTAKIVYHSGRVSHTASAAIAPGAGIWEVGYCVKNIGGYGLDDNDQVNGWVMVTTE